MDELAYLRALLRQFVEARQKTANPTMIDVATCGAPIVEVPIGDAGQKATPAIVDTLAKLVERPESLETVHVGSSNRDHDIGCGSKDVSQIRRRQVLQGHACQVFRDAVRVFIIDPLDFQHCWNRKAPSCKSTMRQCVLPKSGCTPVRPQNIRPRSILEAVRLGFCPVAERPKLSDGSPSLWEG